MEISRMATRRRFRPVQGLVLALLMVPAWKLAERFLRPGPKPASAHAVKAGRELFVREWSVNDSLASGDGLGPVFNAASCLDCHRQGGPGGAGPAARNITVYGLSAPHPRGFPRSGVVHQRAVAPEFQETLRLVHPSLPATASVPPEMLPGHSRARNPIVMVTQRNTPALFGSGLIDAIPEETIIAHHRERSVPARLVGFSGPKDPKIRGKLARLADGRVGRFGWKGEFATLHEFVKAACATELGLSNPGRPQPTPLGKASYMGKGIDLTEDQCTLLTDFVRSLPAPAAVAPADRASIAEADAGKELFHSIGCAECHVESPAGVQGLYSDLLLHDMGADLESSAGAYETASGPTSRDGQPDRGDQPDPSQWRTAPLWGVADSPPYLHDGRAESLEDAIRAHAGEAAGVIARFRDLAPGQQQSIISFLNTLRAPPAESAPAASALAIRGAGDS
jgi:CxxC motif-containing protein (DUF1111 family)